MTSLSVMSIIQANWDVTFSRLLELEQDGHLGLLGQGTKPSAALGVVAMKNRLKAFREHEARKDRLEALLSRFGALEMAESEGDCQIVQKRLMARLMTWRPASVV